MKILETKEGRETLIWACSYINDIWGDDASYIQRLLDMDWRLESPIRFDALVALIDPAKLAEMIAWRGRQLGLEFWHGPNESREPSPTDYVLYVLDGCIRLYSPLSPKTWRRQYTVIQARHIFFEWLQLPNGDKDAAEKVLRGESNG